MLITVDTFQHSTRFTSWVNIHIFTLNMAAVMYAETLDNFQHSTRRIPESRKYTLKSSSENLRTKMSSFFLSFFLLFLIYCLMLFLHHFLLSHLIFILLFSTYSTLISLLLPLIFLRLLSLYPILKLFSSPSQKFLSFFFLCFRTIIVVGGVETKRFKQTLLAHNLKYLHTTVAKCKVSKTAQQLFLF
jgi:hypothetical protein